MRISDWSADVCSSDLLADLFQRHRQALGHFFRRRLSARFVEELAAAPDELVDRLDHVAGDADRARLVGDRARDRLATPPGRLGAELVAAALLSFDDRLHQAHISFLPQFRALHTTYGIFFGLVRESC